MVEPVEQRTLSWYRMRLGYITGSQVGLLMKSGKSGPFSETSKSYIYQVAAERSMNPVIIEDDELFEMYISQTDVTSKAMRFGTEQEDNARRLYSKICGVTIDEASSCRHPYIPYFASSPDGLYMEGADKVSVEIKSPNQSTFMRYKNEIHSAEDLLRVKPEYFYQCMAHMMCTGSVKTVFIAYNPFQKEPIHFVPIYPDKNVFSTMEERITIANDIIGQIINE